IGAAVDREAADLLAEDHAAGARRALEDDERAAAQVELVRRREPRDPAADDRRVENGDWGLGFGGWIDHGRHSVLRCNQSLITDPPNPQSPVGHSRARTRSSSIATNVGDVLSDSVRRSVVENSRATRAAWMSMSNRISV